MTTGAAQGCAAPPSRPLLSPAPLPPAPPACSTFEGPAFGCMHCPAANLRALLVHWTKLGGAVPPAVPAALAAAPRPTAAALAPRPSNPRQAPPSAARPAAAAPSSVLPPTTPPAPILAAAPAAPPPPPAPPAPFSLGTASAPNDGRRGETEGVRTVGGLRLARPLLPLPPPVTAHRGVSAAAPPLLCAALPACAPAAGKAWGSGADMRPPLQEAPLPPAPTRLPVEWKVALGPAPSTGTGVLAESPQAALPPPLFRQEVAGPLVAAHAVGVRLAVLVGPRAWLLLIWGPPTQPSGGPPA